jgi:hypothetical protein
LKEKKYVNLGDNILNIRTIMNQEVKTHPGLNILTNQAGTGKSTWIIQKTKEFKGKTLIIVPNHDLVQSTYSDLIYWKKSSYLQGWNKICPKKDDNDFLIRVKQTIPSFPVRTVCEFVCGEVNRKKCPYTKQFFHFP